MTTNIPPHLIAEGDQVVARILDALPKIAPPQDLIIMGTFTPCPDDPELADRWERTCDSCRTYVPDDQPFYTGQMSRQPELERTAEGDGQVTIILTLGFCQSCAAKMPDADHTDCTPGACKHSDDDN